MPTAALIEQFRWSDALDVLVIAAVIFALLIGLRRPAFRALVLGLGLLLAVFVTARSTNMVMTRALTQAAFVLLGVAGVVVFQSDIRNLFDRLTAIRLRGRGPPRDAAAALAETVTVTCTKMAQQRIGALIAFRGREDWDRQVTGGIELGAVASEPLLLSIFQRDSPGHDGAVLVADGKLVRFGAHLPLSKNLAEIGVGGTRHAAALGLSEVCDALVVVVSEERGTISIAERGALAVVDGRTLHARLDGFLHFERRGGDRRDLRHLLQNLLAAVLALAASATLWFTLVHQAETVTRRFQVPIETRNLAPGLVIASGRSSPVTVALTGPETVFDRVDPAEIVLSFDLSGVSAGTYTLDLDTDGELKNAGDLELEGVVPERLRVEIQPVVERELPVRPNLVGGNGEELPTVVVEPATVRVVLTPDGNQTPDAVRTEPIDVAELRRLGTVEARLVRPRDARFAEGVTPTAQVRVQ